MQQKINEVVMAEENQIKRSSCPVSCIPDILDDKWILLVIREKQ